MSAPRVLILSSQALFAEALCTLLERERCEVIGDRAWGAEVPGLIASLRPDVVVLDAQSAPPAAAVNLLDCAPDLRIVQISLQDKVIVTYDHRQSAAPGVQTFLDLVALRDRLSSDVNVSPDPPVSPGTGNP